MGLTQQRLKEVISYDADTGVFVWIKPTCRRYKVGMLAGTINSSGYRIISIDKQMYRAHRLAFLYMIGKLPVEQMDHINLNKLDNRWINLREATRGQNNMNRVASNKLKIKNVYQNQQGTYNVMFRLKGENIYLGSFEDVEFADLVATEYREKHHKEFVRHSFNQERRPSMQPLIDGD